MRVTLRRGFLLGCIGVALLPTTGCRSNMGPKMPKELGAPALYLYPKDQFQQDVQTYRTDVASGQLDAAKAMRNQMAYRVMADIESNYGSFEMKLSSGRAIQATLADATTLGLTAATTVVGASDVKDILAATGTAFQGTWTSYDKNFFQQKTTEALIAQMRASRKTKLAQLITGLATRDVTSYPWDAVWIDLVDFYYAGTVPSAMVEIASNAGSNAQTATEKLNNAMAALTPRTPAQAQEAVDIRGAFTKLAAAINGQDAAAASTAAAKVRKILTDAGYSPTSDENGAALLADLRKAMADASADNDKLAKLSQAIAAADVK